MERQNTQQPYIQKRILSTIDLNKEKRLKKLFKRIAEQNVSNQQCKYMKKKLSLKTTSSNYQYDSNILNTNSYLTQQQLNLTNIQLFEKNLLNIKNTEEEEQISEIFNYSQNQTEVCLSSFALIKIPQKHFNVSIDNLKSINFPVLSYSINELITFSVQILNSQQYCQLNYSKKQIEEFIKLIALNYKTISYHNFSHAFSLMQLNFSCVQMIPSFKNKFTSEERFYVIIAGLSHDLNHNGTNNMFEINRNSSIAMAYNYKSVLQNMHISTLWKILKDNPRFDFLKKSSNSIKAKQIITRLILSTDMSIHFQKIQVLKDRRNKNNLNLDEFEDKMFMMEQLFHSCDLGNPTLDYSSYITWASLLSYEFNIQFKLEEHYNLQQTSCLQYRNIKCFYEDQITFVGKVVQPLWKELALHFNQLNVFKDKIKENIAILNQMYKQQQNQKV